MADLINLSTICCGYYRGTESDQTGELSPWSTYGQGQDDMKHRR